MTDTSHSCAAAHPAPAGDGDQSNGSHVSTDTHTTAAADALVLIAADVLDDLERTRIATENRLRSLTHETVEGERGGWFGKGLDPDMPEVRRVQAILDGLAKLEHEATLNLNRAVRQHPLGGWVKRTVGVGEKQAGRLLAAIGNPADRRTVSQLWAYCGYHVLNPGFAGDPTAHIRRDTHFSSGGGDIHTPGHVNVDTQVLGAGGSGNTSQSSSDTQASRAGVAPSRKRGEKANWSSTAKMRAYLIAESCIKQRHSPYRPVYDAAREKYADAVHAHACKRCGPSGNPAPAGSPLSDGHKHARAMRLVSKAILRDLWIEARQTIVPSEPIHEASGGLPTPGHTSTGNQTSPAGGGSSAATSHIHIADPHSGPAGGGINESEAA